VRDSFEYQANLMTRPYNLPNNVEVAGYVEAYDQFTFATIKGAGHEVNPFLCLLIALLRNTHAFSTQAPQYQPAKAYYIISNFVKSGTIP